MNNAYAPKVSVIFPIYNNEKYLRRCIESVINQTLKEIELILIDDGSTDGAPAICDEFAAKDDRIIVIHKENAGSAAGRNQGMELARGEYIAFVESDDWTAPNMYEELYRRAEETDAEIVKCGFFRCNEGFEKEEMFLPRNAKCPETFTAVEKPQIFLYHASIWASLYKLSFIRNKDLRFIETPAATYSDFSWMAMTYATAERITVLHKTLYYYNCENSASSSRYGNEKSFYMPYHCVEANRILREKGIFKSVQEEVSRNEYRASLGFAAKIRPDLRVEYFRRFQNMMQDACEGGIQFKYFAPRAKKMALLVLLGKYKSFYRCVSLLNAKTATVRFLKANRITSTLYCYIEKSFPKKGREYYRKDKLPDMRRLTVDK